ncbi:MAG: hypothetical protein K0Q68_1086 [Moraxellaceae bacterium]|nr:hypothetical protein [Moraxellaceae bacterium]
MQKFIKDKLNNFLSKAVTISIIAFISLVLVIAFQSIARASDDRGAAIGDLGGVPVVIPKVYTNLMGYSRDSSFSDKFDFDGGRKNYKSKINRLGFQVRYPDMASLGAGARTGESIFTTTWMRVVISSGDSYGSGGDGFLDRKLDYHLSASRTCKSKCIIYAPMKNDVHGLVGYATTGSGVDIEKRKINFGRGADLRDRNIYVFKGKDGKVLTLIECGNREHDAERCQQYFNLRPDIRAHVQINYRKALLPHWKEIQRLTTELVVGFRVK